MIIIDWEQSKIGHPAIDIADFCIKANLTSKQKEIFYINYGADKNLQKIVEVYIITSTLSIICWNIERIEQIKKARLTKDSIKA